MVSIYPQRVYRWHGVIREETGARTMADEKSLAGGSTDHASRERRTA